MSIRFEEKVALVARWAPVFARAEAVVVFRHHGIHGPRETELRRALSAGGEGRYLLLKNRLARRALAGTRHEALGALLRGQTSFFVIHGDPQPALRRLFAYLDERLPRRLDTDLPIKGWWLHAGGNQRQKAYRLSRYQPPELAVAAGSLDGALRSPEELRHLASLPSRDELRSRLLATMAAPASRLLGTMAAPAEALVRLLAARGG